MRVPQIMPCVLTLVSAVSLAVGVSRAHWVGDPPQLRSTSTLVPSEPTVTRTLNEPRRQTETSAQTSAGTLDQMISSDAAVYVEMRDVRAQVEALRLIETLKSFWPLLAPDLKLAPDRGTALETLWTTLAPSLQGAHLAVAVWPNDVVGAPSGEKKKQEPAVGIFIKFASSDQLRQVMQRREDIEQAVKRLVGEKSEKPKSEMTLTTVNDTLAFGDPRVLEHTLRAEGGVKKLADDPDFKVARARWTDTPVFLYADLAAASKLAADKKEKPAPSENGSKKSSEDTKDNLSQTAGELVDLEQLPKLAVGVRFAETHTIIKTLLLEGGSATGSSKGWSAALKPSDAGLPSARWQSPQTSASFTVSLDWQTLYDLIVPPLEKMFATKEGQGMSPIPMAEALIGYKIRDQLLPALGNLSLSFQSLDWVMPSSADSRGMSSSPQLTVLLGLRNQEVVEGALKNVAKLIPKEAGPSAEGDKEGGIPITKLGSWGYAVVDGFLALSSDAEVLRQVIKGPQSGRTLATDPDFVRASQWMPPQLAAWGYVSPAAAKQFFGRLRSEAIKDEPQLASVLAQFSLQAQPASLAAWKEDVGLAGESHVPEGVLPILIASGIASKRAADRDQAITEKAVAALAENQQLSSVEVSTKDGIVTLTGAVKSDAAKSLAQQLVQKIEGVKSVINEIEVEPEQ